MAQGVSVDDAIRHIVMHRATPRVVTLPLDACLGRLSAKTITAQVNLPPADVSAMDGYAVRLSDTLHADAALKLIGEASAGVPFSGTVGTNEAARIFTGGVIPEGADHVLIQEHTERSGPIVRVTEPQTETRHIRAAAGDFAKGQTLIAAGRRLGPAELGLAAAANHAQLSVYRSPRVAILANGDELRAPGSVLDNAQIVSSTPTALCALIRSWGFEATQLGIADDNEASLRALIEAGRDADIIVPVGGASVGDKDLMKPAFTALRFEPIFEKIIVKPGKPTWFGTLGDQRILGLPGNPAAAFIGAVLYLRPLLGLCDRLECVEAEALADLPGSGPRETFMQAKLQIRSGRIGAIPLERQSSASVSGLVQSDCLIRRLPAAPALSKGEMAQIVLLKTALF